VSSLQIGTRLGGRQAPRRESLLSLRFGRLEAAATLVSLLYAGLAWYLVGALGLTSPEAVARTVRVGAMWDGFEPSVVGFGFDRPPLLTALAAPFGSVEALRGHGLTAAVTTAATGGFSVIVAGALARHAGLTRPATVLFVLAFALNPLLVYAGVFGLPEALYTALMLVALWQFGEWVERRNVASVVMVGFAIGVAFLLRYNVVLIALVVGWAFWWVARQDERETRQEEAARATALAFMVPVVFVAGLWTLLAWFPRGEFLGYLREASALSRLGGEDLAVIQRTADLRWNVLGTMRWVGGWALLVAPASAVAVAGLAAYGLYEGRRGQVALALVSASVLLPEAMAVFTGHGQAHVPHLFVAAAPVFAIFAYRERRRTRGVRPSAYERPRRRAQVAGAGGLLLASLASAVVLLLMPVSDPPAVALEETVRTGVAPAAVSEDVLRMADFIRAEAGRGDVLADVQRHALLMLTVGDLDRFHTPASTADEAALYESFEAARYILVRRPLHGQGEGRIEQAYEDAFAGSASSLSLAFEAGDYRLYAVMRPAIP